MTEEQTLRDYLATVKDGDKVLVRGGANYTVTKHAVVKVTKTQVVIAGSLRFKLTDGLEIGGTKWSPRRIVVPTEENLKTELVGRMDRWAKGRFPEAFAKLRIEQRQEIYKLVNTLAAEADD
jgi:hypothetical protein